MSRGFKTHQEERFWSRRVNQEEYQFCESQQEKRELVQAYLASSVSKARQAVAASRKHHRISSQP